MRRLTTSGLHALFALTVSLVSASHSYALPPELLRQIRSPEEQWAVEPLSPAEIDAKAPGSQVYTPSTAAPNWDGIFGAASQISHGIILGLPGSAFPTPYQRNSTVTYRPASNTKLFTISAALEKLGRDYRFETRLDWKEDAQAPADQKTATELNVIGGGDPTWGLWDTKTGVFAEIQQLATQLAEAGVTRIEGPITFRGSDARWANVRYPQGWSSDEYTACYGALPQAFNVQLNCATFVVTDLNTGHWVESGVPMAVSVKLVKAAKTDVTVTAALDANGVPKSFAIIGTVTRSSRTETSLVSFSLPISQTSEWVKNLFIADLPRVGITYAPQATAPLPADRVQPRTLSTWSAPLSQIMKPFLKDSINLIGEALFKKLGETFSASEADLTDAGRTVIRSFLPSIPATDAVFWDGSGISRTNAVTPMNVLATLQWLHARSEFPDVWDSLPIAGVDGTIASRMKGTPAEGVLRAKTGTLSGTYNLSGFVPRFGTAPDASSPRPIVELIPFVMLSQTTSDFRVPARLAQDHAGADLSGVINP